MIFYETFFQLFDFSPIFLYTSPSFFFDLGKNAFFIAKNFPQKKHNNINPFFSHSIKNEVEKKYYFMLSTH